MSRRNRRLFTDEFKYEAASMVVTQGCFVAEASRAMGVGTTATIYVVLGTKYASLRDLDLSGNREIFVG